MAAWQPGTEGVACGWEVLSQRGLCAKGCIAISLRAGGAKTAQQLTLMLRHPGLQVWQTSRQDCIGVRHSCRVS